jgi:hypothetical protein
LALQWGKPPPPTRKFATFKIGESKVGAKMVAHKLRRCALVPQHSFPGIDPCHSDTSANFGSAMLSFMDYFAEERVSPSTLFLLAHRFKSSPLGHILNIS